MNEDRYRTFGHDGRFFVLDTESGLAVSNPTERDAAERMAAELSREETVDG